jgi:sec-independent protein translocase protein TatB
MFDIGIWEFGVIGVVALVVLGPERLPKVARTAGHLFGRLQRYVATVKTDINREMEISEFAKVKEEVQSAARSFEQTVQENKNAIETEARGLEDATNKVAADAAKSGSPATTPSLAPPEPPAHPAPSQAEALAAQEAGMHGTSPPSHVDSVIGNTASDAAPATPAYTSPSSASRNAHQQFDLGIEPPRVRRER